MPSPFASATPADAGRGADLGCMVDPSRDPHSAHSEWAGLAGAAPRCTHNGRIGIGDSLSRALYNGHCPAVKGERLTCEKGLTGGKCLLYCHD